MHFLEWQPYAARLIPHHFLFLKCNLFSPTEESYTVRLPVNVLNTATEGEGKKPFTKIGFVEFSSDATLSAIRAKLKREFSEILHGRVFLFQDAMMADVEPSSEQTTKSMYNLSVIIRFANNQGKQLL